MAVMRPEIKEKLKADGRWGSFVKARSSHVKEGKSPSEAFDLAVAEVCPEFAEVLGNRRPGRKPSGGLKARADGRSLESDKADAVERIVAAKEKLARMDGEEERKRERKSGVVGMVSAEVFAGKPKASAAEEVLWVAKHLGVEVGPEDAPGELAWNFLMLCRESAEFRVKFMLNIASDVVKRRSDEDGERDGKFDGSEEFDLLGEFAAKLREVCGASGEVAG